SRPFGGRPICFYGGNCSGYGCPVDAKATTLSVSIPRALATGRLDLRPNAVAREISVDVDGRARSVRYLDWKGREQEVFARVFVLAGNAVGSARLLLSSTSGSFPEGLANSSGLVGKNLMLHLGPMVGFRIDAPALGSVGMAGHVAIDDLHPSDAKRGFLRGGVIAETNGPSDQPIGYFLASRSAPGLGRGFGADLKRFLRGFPHTVFVRALLEDLPMESNRVELDPEQKDAHGLPVARITHRNHPNDVAIHAFFTKRLVDLAEASGALEKWVVDLPGITTIDRDTPMRGGLHVLGTCRMGKDPSKSVVDAGCRSHDVRNLWVVDGSVFPTSGGYDPGLTILANAYRVAARFVEEAKKANLR
ncbi:MAG: GMC oxidoreductase, partial [Candidatus Binatia bacterium]